MKDKLDSWMNALYKRCNTLIQAATLLPFVGGIYIYAYIIFSKIYNTNIKNIGFSFGNVTHKILVYMMCGIIIIPSTLLIIICFIDFITSSSTSFIKEMIPPYDYDKYRKKWDIILLVISAVSFLLFAYMKANTYLIKANSYLIYIMVATLVSTYLLFSSLNKHLEFYQGKCLSAGSSIKKYTSAEKICLSLKKLYGTYLLFIIFVYPMPRLNNDTLDGISIVFILIQIALITSFICGKKIEKGKSIINSELIIGGILIPLLLAIVERLLGIK